MAKKDKGDIEQKPQSKGLGDLLKGIRKETGSASFKNAKYSRISHFIDTGCFALNRIISGDIHGGIPAGRVTMLFGESASGKSLIASRIGANAVNKHGYSHVFYFDSEGGGLLDMMEGFNLDPDKIEHVLCESVENATQQMLKVLSALAEFKSKPENEDAKFLIILDSLGALVTNKVYTDAVDKDKQVMDMGLRARLCNTLLKSLTIPSMKADVPVLVINHIYDATNQMYPSKIKEQSGGKGTKFIPTISIQCDRRFVKSEESCDEATYKGNMLRFFTAKNRIVKPFFEAEMYVDFSTGIAKYDGLIDAAIAYGFIKQEGAYYTVPSYRDVKLRRKDIETNDAIWSTFLEDFNAKSKADMSYSKAELEKMLTENSGGEAPVEEIAAPTTDNDVVVE